MFIYLARALDALFSSTSTIVTTQVTTLHYPKPADYKTRLNAFNAAAGTVYTPSCPLRKNDPSLTEDQRRKLELFIAELISVKEMTDEGPFEEELAQSSFRVFTDENILRLEERDIPIPQIIKDRPPLMLGDKPNYLSFPQYQDMALTVSYRRMTTKFASINGRVLRARDKVSNRTRCDILTMHQQQTGMIEADPAVSLAKIHVDLNELVFAVHPDYLYFEITRANGSIMVITLDNKDQTKTDRQSVILAYALTRAVIYSYFLNGDPLQTIEADFAALIATLIFSIRTEA